MGRRAISGGRKSDRPLRIRLTDGERDALDDAAARQARPTSAWARDVLIASALASEASASKNRTTASDLTPPELMTMAAKAPKASGKAKAMTAAKGTAKAKATPKAAKAKAKD